MNTLFRTILNMSLSGGVVIVAVMAARLLLRRAPKKWSYLLWSAAAFRLVCPVSLRSEFSLFRLLPAGLRGAERGGFVSALEAIPSAERMEAGVQAAQEAILSASEAGASGQAVSSISETAQSALSDGLSGATPAISASPAAPLPAAPVDWLTVLGWVWLGVAACLLLFGAVNYLLTRKRLAAAIRLEGQVYQSELVSSPFILGLIRPRIYIPYGLEGDELRYALAHETRHLRRGDPWFKLLAWLLLCLHWFNPLVWLAFFLMGRDMEMSCDEAVLASGGDLRQGYSRTLLSFAVKQGFPRPNPLCFGETGVKSRVQNALRWKRAGTALTLGALVLCLALIAGCALNPPEALKKKLTTEELLSLAEKGDAFRFEDFSAYAPSQSGEQHLIFLLENNHYVLDVTGPDYTGPEGPGQFRLSYQFRPLFADSDDTHVKYLGDYYDVIDLRDPGLRDFLAAHDPSLPLSLNADGTLGLLRWGMTPEQAAAVDPRIVFTADSGESWTTRFLRYEVRGLDFMGREATATLTFSSFDFSNGIGYGSGPDYYLETILIVPEDPEADLTEELCACLGEQETHRLGYGDWWDEEGNQHHGPHPAQQELPESDWYWLAEQSIFDMVPLERLRACYPGQDDKEMEEALWAVYAWRVDQERTKDTEGKPVYLITANGTGTVLARLLENTPAPRAESSDSLSLNADGTLGLLHWGMTPEEAARADARILFDSGRGGELFETWTQKELSLFGERLSANFIFVTQEGNTFLNAMELCFTGPFDKAAVISQLEGLWGPRIDHYTSMSGQELPAPEENWWWELEGGVKAQFAVSDGLPALCLDATALNAAAGRYGELTGRERALDYSEEQLELINEELAPVLRGEDGSIVSASPVSCFFTSFYEDVHDLDLEAFLRYCPVGEEVTDSTELAAVAALEEERFGMAQGTHTLRYRVRDVDGILLEYAGIKVDELSTDWMNELCYLPEYDAFYNHTSDFAAGTFRAENGNILIDTGEEWLWSVPPGEDGTALLLKRQYVPYHFLITAFMRVDAESLG